ncbi:CaiB/BaiF CoA transferase family protein [Thermodesulfobacteriota bacterium]
MPDKPKSHVNSKASGETAGESCNHPSIKSGAFEGIRIVEVGAFLNGIGAGSILGDLGAEVIKVEEPGKGDSFRGMHQMYGDIMSVKGRHVGFETANRNKKSLTLNLKKEEGRKILYELISNSDVFYSNYNRSVLKRLNIDYSTLKKRNPRLIYIAISGYGEKGPSSNKRAFDLIGLARSGLMWQMGERDFDEPVVASGGICDLMGSIVTAFAIVSALLTRERLGIAQEVKTSLLGSSIFLNTLGINVNLLRGRGYARHSRKKSKNPLSNYYRCADGKWILLCEIQSDRFWTGFCDILGLVEEKEDPRFATSLSRRKNSEELIVLIDKIFATKARDEWLQVFKDKNAQFAFSPIYETAEVASDLDALANRYITEYDHELFGHCKMIGFPAEFSETPARIQRGAPELGQHTEDILIDTLGYGWNDIERLRNEEIV